LGFPGIIGGLVTELLALLLGWLPGGGIGAILGLPTIPVTVGLGEVITIPIGALVTEFLAGFFTANFCSFWKSLSHNITEIVLIILGPVEVNAAYVDGSTKAFLDAAWKLIDNLIP